MTSAEYLIQAKEELAANIATMELALTTSDDASSYSIDGQSFTKQHLDDKLQKAYLRYEKLLALIQLEEGPFEITSYGV